MRSLGDKIRDAIIDKHGKKGELKATTMARAAGLLGISKTGLYTKLQANPIDPELLNEIQKILGVDVESLKISSETELDEVANSKMKPYTFRIKSGEAKVFLPANSDREDVKTLIQYLTLFEKNL